MFHKIKQFFKKPPEQRPTEITLSKLDKHLNFLLRDRTHLDNKRILELCTKIEEKRGEVILLIRQFHKKSLYNSNIPQREIQIMEGNREQYVKRTSHFVHNIELPKGYLELYTYCVVFAEQLEALSKEIQKSLLVLKYFFDNEITGINSNLREIENSIIDIRIMFEKANIESFSKIQEDMREIKKLRTKILSLKSNIAEQEKIIAEYQDRVNKLNQKIQTTKSGTDYRALEQFQAEKQDAEEECKKTVAALNTHFSEIDTAMKKYFYKNQDRKILRTYFDDLKHGLIDDKHLEIADIIKEIKGAVERDEIELKDKKRENTLASLSALTADYLKNKQVELAKFEDMKQHAQTRITHNSAALNLAETEYWIKTNQEKIAHHQEFIDKYAKEIEKSMALDHDFKEDIRQALSQITGESVTVVDDLEEETPPV